MKGSSHLMSLGVVADTLAMRAYRADAFAMCGDKLSDGTLGRMMEAANEVQTLVASIRQERGEETVNDAVTLVLAGKRDSYTRPGQWTVARNQDGSLRVEVFNA